MKKQRPALDTERKRLEEQRFLRRLGEKRRRAQRRAFEHGHYGQSERVSRGFGRGAWEDLKAPKVLDLLSERQATCEFFEHVHHSLAAGRKVRMYFGDTEKISSECLIYLLAQTHKLRLQFGLDSITGTYPRSRKIERLMADSGFLSVLGVRRRKIIGRPATGRRFIKYKSDTEIRGSCIPELRDELLGEDLKMPPLVGKMVFRALTEAMANVKHHAYGSKHVRLKKLRDRWWLGAQLSVRKNYFELTFYDAGVGIPKTLHRKYPMEYIREVLSILPGFSPDDAQMIKAAVELGRTRTDESNRGKGLLDIHKIITSIDAGALTIISRYGEYRYTPRSERIVNHDTFLEGTLIKWELPLDKVVDAVNPNLERYDEDN